MNLDTEVRNGYTISSEMKKVWNIQIKMVVKLMEVCQKYNLKIWADGGTLLGVIRHHGYIPWDDDIDMVMLREDYDKLLKIALKEFQDPFFFQDAYTDKLYPRGHAQLRYNGTAAILPHEVHCHFNQSIFIDIFVYDALPKDKNVFVAHAVKAEILRNLLYSRVSTISKAHGIKELAKWAFARVFFTFNDFRRIYSKFENLYACKGEELSNEYSCPTFILSQVFKIIRKKEWYSDTLYMPFEDILMPVPVGYDEILTNQYGDYMTPVKAPSCHGGVIFDAERSYKEVLKDIKSGKIDLRNYLNE